MMERKSSPLSLLLLLVIVVISSARNIVHIIIDDLRNELGTYNPGHPIYTPSIDKLAAEGVTFDRAYAQQAVCNPSRASFMTGRRPDTTRVYNLEDNWRVKHQHWTSLPGMFLDNGFLSLGSGKTYHDTCQGELPDLIFEYDGNRSWSQESLPYRNPCWTQGVDCLPCPDTHWNINNVSADWCIREEGDLSDVLTTKHALTLLHTALETKPDTPFYLAVGYHKPHLPWIAKQEHFDLYPLESIVVSPHPTLHESVPEIAYSDSHQSPSPYEAMPDDQAKLARRAYYAAISGMDEEVGKLLQGLKDAGVEQDTAVILHGDHGYHLGEYAQWKKNTNWEECVKTPLIMKVPWIEGIAGTHTSALAELIDIMPTMAELAGVPLPIDKIGDLHDPIEGVSLVPALSGSNVHSEVFSQYPRKPEDDNIPWENNGVDHSDPSEFKYMGYSVRVDGWRYTEWYHWNQSSLQADWGTGGLYKAELYDFRESDILMQIDPGFTGCNYDNETSQVLNVVSEAVNSDDIVLELSAKIRNQFAKP